MSASYKLGDDTPVDKYLLSKIAQEPGGRVDHFQQALNKYIVANPQLFVGLEKFVKLPISRSSIYSLMGAARVEFHGSVPVMPRKIAQH